MRNNNVLIIAELSANHNNDLDLAVQTIKAMADAGADAVKVQTYKAESLTIDMDTGYFAPMKNGLWKGYTPWKLFSEAAMPYEWHPKLKSITEELGMIFFSSPFDQEGVDYLESINISMYKIASLEITDIPLIEYIASKGKPMIFSTGVAEREDIDLAIDVCKNAGNCQVTLLKCTSQYPASIEDANLLTIPHMKETFDVEVGISDHTMGSIAPVVAVSLGATVVEKHFILDRNLGGADSAFSMEPEEFKEMVKAIRKAESAMGKISYKVSMKDKNRRRSLFVVNDILVGEEFSRKNIKSIRPGYGLHPKLMDKVVGKKANRDIKKGTPLRLDYIA